MKGWDRESIKRMLNDPEFNQAHKAVLEEAIAPRKDAVVDNGSVDRGRANRASGERFEDEIDGLLSALYHVGAAMIFNADPKVKFIGKGQIVFKGQKPGGPPSNPPDYVGTLLGMPVGIDAKVCSTSITYYVGKKKRPQHEGIRAMSLHGTCGLFGYIIKWAEGNISFVDINDCLDGKVRRENSKYYGTSIDDIFRQYVEENDRPWPL